MELASFSKSVAAEASVLSYSMGEESPASAVLFAPGPCYFMAVHNGPPVLMKMEGYGRPREACLVSGCINLIPAGTRSLWSWDQSCRSIRLSLPEKVVAEALEESKSQPPAVLEPLLAFRDPVIQGVALRLATGVFDPFDTLYRESATRFLAFHILRILRDKSGRPGASEEPKTGRLSEKHLARLRNYLDDNLASSLTLETMARQVHLSQSRFAHSFKAATGESPHRYVMRLRCERAVELIRRKHALAEIAVQCGFADQSHMGRRLRKFIGRSPASLRET